MKSPGRDLTISFHGDQKLSCRTHLYLDFGGNCGFPHFSFILFVARSMRYQPQCVGGIENVSDRLVTITMRIYKYVDGSGSKGLL